MYVLASSRSSRGLLFDNLSSKLNMAPALLQAAALALGASTIVPSCPTLPSCPQDDNCTFNANNNIFQVSCATDFYGGDLFLAQVSTESAVEYLRLRLIDVDVFGGLLHEGLLNN